MRRFATHYKVSSFAPYSGNNVNIKLPASRLANFILKGPSQFGLKATTTAGYYLNVNELYA